MFRFNDPSKQQALLQRLIKRSHRFFVQETRIGMTAADANDTEEK